MPDLTFLLGSDAGGFYPLARQYFTAAGSTIADATTLEEVCAQLTAAGTEQQTVNLVSAPRGFAALDCAVTTADHASGRRTSTEDDLRSAVASTTVTPPRPGVVTPNTRVVIYGSDVGRATRFLALLSGLLGNPGELLAPRRMGVFQVAGGSSAYRLARTWSVVGKAPLSADPAEGWPAFRTAFVTAAAEKFGGGVELKAVLTTAADGATLDAGATFFSEQGVDLVVATPRANGDPVTAAATTAMDIDDTTTVTTVTNADAFPLNATLVISVVTLAQVIDGAVPIAEGAGYRRLTSSAGVAPALDEHGDARAQSFDEEVQKLATEMLTAGAAQADVDAFLAAIPRGDATAGLALAPDVPPPNDDPDALEVP